MKDILVKLNKIKENIISQKNGVFYLFCLLERTDLQDKWDILISADWLEKSNSENDLVFFIENLKTEFQEDISFLSKIVLLTPDENFVKAIGRAILSENNTTGEFTKLRVFPDLTLKRVIVIDCNFQGLDLSKDVELKKEVTSDNVEIFK